MDYNKSLHNSNSSYNITDCKNTEMDESGPHALSGHWGYVYTVLSKEKELDKVEEWAIECCSRSNNDYGTYTFKKALKGDDTWFVYISLKRYYN